MRLNRVFQAWIMLAALSTSLIGQSSSVFAAEKVSADRRLPPGVLLYLSVPDAPTAYQSFQATGVSELIHDPALEDFRQQLVDKYKEWEEDAQDEVGLPLSDLTALFSGEVTLALVRPVGQSLGGVLFMDIGNHQDILDQLLKKAEEEAENEDDVDVDRETETIGGTKVTIYTVTPDEEDADPITIAYFVKDNTFVVASTTSILETVLDQWDGTADESETFAGNKIYQEIIRKCSTNERTVPAFKYFIDPVGLIATGLGMNKDTQLFAGMVYAPAFGLTALKGIGGTLELATDEYDSISRSMYYVDGPASGILKVFELRPAISNVPDWVPADAGQYVAFDWNLQGAYEAIESIYDSFTGPGKFAAMVDGLAQQGGGLHLKKDVIDVLSGRIEWYMTPAADPEDIEGTLAIGVNDAGKAQKLINSLLEMAGGGTSSDFNGTQLYLPSEDDKPGAAAIKGNTILVTKDVEQLKQVLSGPAKSPLTQSEDFKSVAKNLPETMSLLSFQDPADQLEAGYEKARAGDFDSFTEGKLDFSVLPPFDAIRKYLSPTATYFIPDPDGHGTLGVQFSVKHK